MKPVIIETTYLGEVYVVSPEWEEALYARSVSELNIRYLVEEKLIDPTNGLPVITRNHTWIPYYCEVTCSHAYKR